MPLYWYKAAKTGGEVVEGTLQATGRAGAVSAIHARGWVPIRVEESAPLPRATAAAGPRRTLFQRRRRVSQQDLAVITRELATLLDAGLPLDQALATLASLAGNPTLVELLGRVRERIQQGGSLADSLAAQGDAFGGLYVSLVRAGEAGGALQQVLNGLADHLERSKEVRDSLVSALIYPAVLVLAAGVSVFLLLGHVVPQFTELFEGVGEELPLATRVTIGVGEMVRSYGWALVLGTFLLALLVRRALQHPATRLRWHGQLLRLPLVGDLVRKVEVGRFARTLGSLVGNGVPLLDALGIVRGTITNTVIAQAVDAVSVRVREGRNLSAPLAEAGCFPAFAVHMIRVGEESGQLEAMLAKVAEVYDREVQTTLRRALSILEPVLILVLGAIIAGIVMSILVAILGINQLVA
jgi:general secretion pathway protein F